MREARGWNQKQLGEAAGIPQANISRVENTRDKFLAFQTLLKIAEALDVALVVKFAPFSELEEWATLPLADSVPPDFLSDSKQREAWEGEARAETEISEPATLDAYILKRYGRQVPETTYPLGIEPPAGGLDGTNRSSQIGGPDVRQAGKREPSRKVS
jgi:transcriptional regulator with XRE-family HTH domain